MGFQQGYLVQPSSTLIGFYFHRPKFNRQKKAARFNRRLLYSHYRISHSYPDPKSVKKRVFNRNKRYFHEMQQEKMSKLRTQNANFKERHFKTLCMTGAIEDLGTAL
jgi:hypothetical protein